MQALRRWLDRFCRRFRPALEGEHGHEHGHGGIHWQHLFLSAVFVASAVHLLKPVVVPLDVLARVVVINFAAAGTSEENHELAILKIDRDLFRAKRCSAPDPGQCGGYGGISPIDRCRLKGDIQAILRSFENLEALGIDFDLSDTNDQAQDDCAMDILAMLLEARERRERQAPRKAPLVSTLILPVDADDRGKSALWRMSVHGHRVQLAEPEVAVQFNVVRQHFDSPESCPGLGVAMAGTSPACRQAFCLADRPAPEVESKHEKNISFHRLAGLQNYPHQRTDGSERMESLSRQIERMPDKLAVKRVLLGPGYDRTDEYLTPVGSLSGVEVHAAIALDPKELKFPLLDFLIDIALGVTFGMLVHTFWGRYFDERLAVVRVQPGWRFGHPLMAYLWLLCLAVVLVAIVLLITWLSLKLIGIANFWISPAPMALGMVIDAMVVGSVAAALQLKTVSLSRPESRWRLLVIHLPVLLWLCLVGYVATHVVQDTLALIA